MHGMLVTMARMVVVGLICDPMHVRRAKDRRQRLSHALQRHADDCEGNQKSNEPGTMHQGNACLRRIAYGNYALRPFGQVKLFVLLDSFGARSGIDFVGVLARAIACG